MVSFVPSIYLIIVRSSMKLFKFVLGSQLIVCSKDAHCSSFKPNSFGQVVKSIDLTLGKLICNITLIRSSHPEVFLRKGVLKIRRKSPGEHPCRSVILIKLQSSFIEITLRHGCSFSPFSRNTSGWMLLFNLWRLYCTSSRGYIYTKLQRTYWVG